MSPLELIGGVLVVYSAVLLMTNGHAFGWWRWLVRNAFWWTEYPVEACRMCQGVWVAIAVGLAMGAQWWEYGILYGGSYFLATQERT